MSEGDFEKLFNSRVAQNILLSVYRGELNFKVCYISLVSREISSTMGNCVKLVNDLIKMGLISKDTSHSKRINALVLTPKGRSVAISLSKLRRFIYQANNGIQF